MWGVEGRVITDQTKTGAGFGEKVHTGTSAGAFMEKLQIRRKGHEGALHIIGDKQGDWSGGGEKEGRHSLKRPYLIVKTKVLSL
jgi:hypothetical protein